MTPEDYVFVSGRTAKQYPTALEDLVHAALGIAGESGEFVDAIKKSSVYGKTLDRDNCIEELGDLMWYMALACRALGTSFETLWETNIEKLRKRYPEQYSDFAATQRADKSTKAVLFKPAVSVPSSREQQELREWNAQQDIIERDRSL